MAPVRVRLPAPENFLIDTMIYIIYAVSILFGVIVTTIINRKEEKRREEMQRIIAGMMQRHKQLATPTWKPSEYLSRIEQASVEIMSQTEPVDKIIVLWWGLDGLRLNEDGSLEWVGRKKEPAQEPVNQNVFCQSPQSMVPVNHQLDRRINMCHGLRSEVDAMRMQIDAIRAQNEARRQYAQASAHMQLPPNYQPAYFYSGLTGCCCDGSILC